MSAPVLLAISTIATIGGASIAAVGRIQEGKAAERAAKYNARIQERNMAAVRDQTSADVADSKRESRRRLAAINASYAANGIDSSTGSALDVFADQATEDALATMRIAYKGELRAQGYSEQAVLDRMKGKSVRSASYIGAASELTTGIGSAIRV